MGNIKKILVLGWVALWLIGAFAVTATAEYDPISPAPNSPTDEEQNVIEDLDSIFSDTEQEDVEYLETITPDEDGNADTADTTPSETTSETTVTTTATTDTTTATTTATTTGTDETGPRVPLPSMFFFSAVALIIFIAGGVAIYVIAKRQVNLRQH